MTAKTLLQLAGADLSPPPLLQAAIVVIDAQREYVDGALPLPDAGAALDKIAALLKQARAAGAPVFHIQHKGRAGGLFDPATTAFAFADGAQPIAGETVVNKGLPNGFAGTDLHEALEKAGRKRLVLAGFMTHMCVSATPAPRSISAISRLCFPTRPRRATCRRSTAVAWSAPATCTGWSLPRSPTASRSSAAPPT